MDSSDCGKLPEHLLESVLERLSSALDYVRFSIVCRSWNSIAKNVLSNRSRLTRPPLLLTYTGKEETWNLCDIRNDKVLDLQLELPNKRFCGFSKGWLLTMDEDFVVTLINPSSRVKGRKTKENSIIRLPALNLLKTDEVFNAKWAKFCDYYVFKATISADPISNAKDCIVVVIHEDSRQMAFIRLDKDTTWTYIKEGIADMEDVVYVKDKLYTVDIFDQLHYFAATTGAKSFDISSITRCFVEEGIIKRYLVEDLSIFFLYKLIKLKMNELIFEIYNSSTVV
ncbi:F-box protein At2g17690-like [Rosa rugosa]|uniref:F-box protein At2g17690-like n=1 Tax=Rosa rugosa TaxID=74645 RepID=UPI002B40F970|nr:F-box protein At2g17690-like [Rosa rugosa]